MSAKQKRLYYTRYGRRFTSHVWAVDILEARWLCGQRKLGEKILCDWHAAGALPASPFDWPASRSMGKAGEFLPDDVKEYWHAEATHAITFLAHVAISSGAAQPGEFLSDTGILHEWIHLGAGQSKNPAKLRADLLRRVKALEKKVPGYCP